MTEGNRCRYQAADYRVRIFLSVDLSGSTAFKNSEAGQERHQGASPKWVTEFQQFYSNFPARYRTAYRSHSNAQSGNDTCPALWKAVGDELIFCGRVTNTKSIIVSIMSFIETLHGFRKDLADKGVKLNVKGAGWLAAFPEPNRAVQMRIGTDEPELFSASEALEAAADQDPFNYDFLGKAIDTGFRVAGSAAPERFVLSVQLARLLASAPEGTGFDYPIHVDQPIVLKGVNHGESYPVLYLDTMKHLPIEEVRQKERQILNQAKAPNRVELAKYLELYCSVVGTDDIALPIHASGSDPKKPQSYLEHCEKISEHLAGEKDREISENGESSDGGGAGSIPQGDGLNPLQD